MTAPTQANADLIAIQSNRITELEGDLDSAKSENAKLKALENEILPVSVRVGTTLIAAGCKVETVMRSIQSYIDSRRDFPKDAP